MSHKSEKDEMKVGGKNWRRNWPCLPVDVPSSSIWSDTSDVNLEAVQEKKEKRLYSECVKKNAKSDTESLFLSKEAKSCAEIKCLPPKEKCVLKKDKAVACPPDTCAERLYVDTPSSVKYRDSPLTMTNIADDTTLFVAYGAASNSFHSDHTCFAKSVAQDSVIDDSATNTQIAASNFTSGAPPNTVNYGSENFRSYRLPDGRIHRLPNVPSYSYQDDHCGPTLQVEGASPISYGTSPYAFGAIPNEAYNAPSWMAPGAHPHMASGGYLAIPHEDASHGMYPYIVQDVTPLTEGRYIDQCSSPNVEGLGVGQVSIQVPHPPVSRGAANSVYTSMPFQKSLVKTYEHHQFMQHMQSPTYAVIDNLGSSASANPTNTITDASQTAGPFQDVNKTFTQNEYYESSNGDSSSFITAQAKHDQSPAPIYTKYPGSTLFWDKYE